MKSRILLLLIVLVSLIVGGAICYCYINLDISSGKEEVNTEYSYTDYSVINKTFENNSERRERIYIL